MSDAHLAARFEAELAKAGLEGCMHAVDIDTGTQVSFRGEKLCVAASTGKVPILVALMRAVGAGDAELDERITVDAGHRTAGPTGLSVMTYPCELALGDVAQLMISISDNHATDIVLSRVSPGRVTAAMRELGLTVTTLDMTISEEYQQRACQHPNLTCARKPPLGAQPRRRCAPCCGWSGSTRLRLPSFVPGCGPCCARA